MRVFTGAILLSFLLLGSCVSLKTPLRKELIQLNGPRKIGRYPVKVDRELVDNGKMLTRSTVLWYHFKNNAAPDSLALKQATHIELELIDDTHLRAGLYKNDSLLKVNILKGKLRNGYFRRKGSLDFMGVPPIYWSVTSSKMQFGIGPESELYIDNASETNGGFLIMLAGTGGATHSLTIPALK
jgi:hypothetical protein